MNWEGVAIVGGREGNEGQRLMTFSSYLLPSGHHVQLYDDTTVGVCSLYTARELVREVRLTCLKAL